MTNDLFTEDVGLSEFVSTIELFTICIFEAQMAVYFVNLCSLNKSVNEEGVIEK